MNIIYNKYTRVSEKAWDFNVMFDMNVEYQILRFMTF
jgi:hypothetical protein